MPEHIKSNYMNIANNKIDVVKLIQENISDINNRYLLMISKPSISCHLLKNILKNTLKNLNFNIFIGSKFKNDFKNNEYHFKLINKIQICMEQGGIIVLKDLDYIYPALYDLLNQNFTVVSNKNFARISISVSNTYYFVNDNFKCIIIVDDDKIQDQETPFLNRFEKHIALFEGLLSDDLVKEANYIYNIFRDLIKQIKNIDIIKHDLEKIFINLNLEEIQGLIYQAKEKGIIQENIRKEVIAKYALTLPQDIMLFINNIQFEYKDLIIENYNKGEHRNLSKFLSTLEHKKNVVYTFSTDLDIIRNINSISNEKFNLNIGDENIKKIKIRGIKSENLFEKELDNFLENDNYKICLIQFTSQEENFMNFIKFFIDNKEKEENVQKKIYIFIVHMNRIFNSLNEKHNSNKLKDKREFKNLNDDFSFLSGYYQIFIDNLNGDENIKLTKIISSTNENLLENYLDLEEELKNNVYKAITYMNYDISLSIKELNKDNYVEKMKKFLQNEENNNLRKLINDCIKKQLIKNNVIGLLYKRKKDNEQEQNENKLVQKPVAFKPYYFELLVSQYDLDILGLIKKYLSNIYSSFFNRFFFFAENDNFLSSILVLSVLEPNFMQYFNNTIDNEAENIGKNEKKLVEKSEINIKYNVIAKIILNYFDEFSFERNDIIFIENQQGANNINILLGLCLPGLRKVIEDILLNIREAVINQYSINESNNINFSKENDVLKYSHELARFNNLTKNEIIKFIQISKILDEFKDKQDIIAEFYYLFINDYLILFSFENFGNDVELEDIKQFFNLKIIKLEGEKNLKVAKLINYIECYKYQICLLLKTNLQNIKKIEQKIRPLLINDIFDKKYDSNKIVDYITKFVRIITFWIYQNVKMNSDIKVIKIKEYFEEAYHNFSKILASINSADSLGVIYSFKFFAEIFFEMYKNKSYDIDTINKTFNFFQYNHKNRVKDDEQNYKKQNMDNFEILYKYLDEKIGKSKNFNKIVNFLIINEIKQTKDDNIQKKFLEIILSNNEILKRTEFEFIFNMSKNNDITYNFKQLDIENRLLSRLNEENENPILEEILTNYFENNINSCFDAILNEKEDNKEEELILPDKPLYIAFSKSLEIFSEEDRNKNNKNLKKLYSISYIKIYLKKFVYFLKKGFYLGQSIISNIDSLIKDIRNLKYKNIIRLYIYKLFHLFSKDEKEFINFDYHYLRLTFFEDFKIQTQNYLINYYNFMPLSSSMHNYFEELKLFTEYPEDDYTNKDKQKIFANEIKNLDVEIFINITINLIITKIGLNGGYSNDKYINFFKFANVVFSSGGISSQINKDLNKLLTKYYDKGKYTEILKIKLCKGMDEIEGFLISLYGFRYCFYSYKNEKEGHNNFYANLLHKKEPNFPNDLSHIPGNTINYDKDAIIERAWKERNTKNLNAKHFNTFKNYYNIILYIRRIFLRFILASYLFFAECLDKYKNNKTKLLNENKSFIEIMREAFIDISIYLKQLSIDSIEIFMNLIFEKIMNLIINVGTFQDIEEIAKFENDVDKVIEETIENYSTKKSEYIKFNFKLLEKKIENAQNDNYLLVGELVPFDKLDKDMKLFMLTNTFNEEKQNDKNYFKNYIIKYGKKFGYEEIQIKYPLINQILFGDENIKNLEHLPNINNLSNYLVNKFSHKISRKDANQKSINDSDFKINKNILQNFLKSWESLGMNKLSEKSLLINFLIDKKDSAINNNIYKTYENFVKYQNEFLEPIIKHSQNKDDIHYFYIDNLKKRINIQDSKNNHIDLTKINLDDIIKKYSKRNIFNNSKSFEYDLALIEKELGELILPGKCLFEISELRSIIFLGEGNPQILTMFENKYPQNKINDKEKDIIMNFSKEKYLQGNNSFKDFYESFHILFFYLSESKNELNAQENIKTILELIPPDLNLSDDFYNFWKDEGKNFKLNKIIEIYLYFEYLHFLLQYLKRQDEFILGKERLNNDDKINSLFDDTEFKNKFIRALRRYITRYLLDNINLENIDEEKLVEKLFKSDLWGINEMNQFDEIKNKLDLFIEKLKLIQIDINVKEAFGLYELLGNNDKEEVHNFIDNIEDDEEDNTEDNEIINNDLFGF